MWSRTSSTKGNPALLNILTSCVVFTIPSLLSPSEANVPLAEENALLSMKGSMSHTSEFLDLFMGTDSFLLVAVDRVFQRRAADQV
jgi:hypothetical protein